MNDVSQNRKEMTPIMSKEIFEEGQLARMKIDIEEAKLSVSIELLVRERVYGLVAQMQVDLKVESDKHKKLRNRVTVNSQAETNRATCLFLRA